MFHNIVFLRYSILLFVFAFFAPGYAEGQSLGVFQSTMDNQQYELKQTGALDLGIYAADGTIVGVLSRKKATEKFKGETRRLAAKCPDNAGKLEVTDWGTARIRMRVETPSVNMTNKMACMVAFLPEWESFDFIRRSAESPVAGYSTASNSPDGTSSARPQTRSVDANAASAPSSQLSSRKSQRINNDSADQPPMQRPSASIGATTPPTDFQELLVQTFLNGAGPFEAGAVTMDEAGNSYIGGTCRGVPIVTKLDSSGRFFHFQTAIAPTDAPRNFCSYSDPVRGFASPSAKVRSIHLDRQGRILIAGYLRYPEQFHSVNAFRPKPTTGANGQLPRYNTEAFVAKLSPDGRTIEYATLLGGLGEDYLYSSTLGPNGELWLTGSTTSADFPRISSLMDYQGKEDVFVVMLDAIGKPRFSSTYGGGSGETGTSLVIAPDGHVLIAGFTYDQAKFPFLPRPDLCGQECGFLMDLDPVTKSLVWVKGVAPSGDSENSEGRAGFNPTSIVLGGSGVIHLAGYGYPNPTASYVRYDRTAEKRLLSRYLGKSLVILTMAARAENEVVFGGTLSRTYELDPSRNGSTPDHGRQAVTGIIDAVGQIRWSYPLSGKNESRIDQYSSLYVAPVDLQLYGPGTQGPFDPTTYDRVTMISAQNDEFVIIGTSTTSSMPTTPKSVQPSPAQVLASGGGETFLLGGDFFAKFKVHSKQPTCSEWIVPARLFLSNQGGQDFYAFVTSNNSACEWSIKSPDPWIKVKTIEGTRGTALLKIDIETNVDDRRMGSIVVTGKTGETFTMQLTQSAVPMGVRLNSTTHDVLSKRGGTSLISIDAAAETEWAVSSTAEWIKVETPSGKGKGSIRIRTEANAGSTPRAGFVLIGDRQVTITQGVEDLPEEGQAATAKTPVPPAAGTPKPAVSRPVPPPNRRIPVPAQKK